MWPCVYWYVTTWLFNVLGIIVVFVAVPESFINFLVVLVLFFDYRVQETDVA